jgi:hypothetical protein
MNEELLRNPGTAQIIKAEINRALMKHGVPITGAVKSDIEARVELVWAYRDAAIRVVDNDGRRLPLEDYLNELRLNPKYAAHFPNTGPPQISIADEARVNANVTRIARGELEVVDDRY